ncbi:6378_t:CDS:2 [Paraglomus occultum]|uniref:6378_t:CDS:1 n=1 Tax=Paraglomus occultum TaxID=144539 RepID=A0A9N8W0Q5_9GLOM|nr:6378_t:CDS:2 [Paraglomus occultum]
MPNESLPVPASIRPTACRMFIGPISANWENKKPLGRLHSHFSLIRLSYKPESEVAGTLNLDVSDTVEQRSSSDFKPITDALTQCQNLQTSSEIFATPTEDIRSSPITPPHWKQPSPNDDFGLSSPAIVSPPTFDTDALQERDRVVSPSLSSAPIAPTTNFPVVENRPTDTTDSIFSEPVVRGSSSVTSDTVLKKGRMLVRVEYVRRGLIEERSKRRTARFSMGWKEYKVVLYRGKLNICNRSTIVEEFDFSEDVRLSLYSSIDYTIALKRLCHHDDEIFLFRSSTYANNFEWYRELHRLFKRRCVKVLPLTCDVFVPDLGVNVRIPVDGYDDAYEMTAEKVKKIVLQQLRVVKEWGELLDGWLGSDQVALCWKKYDRLEWICSTNASDINSKGLIVGPQYIEETHQLQLRHITHYPTDVMLKDGNKMNEPAAVEGFLTILTSGKGENKRGLRFYFTSHDHFLFYTKPKFVKEPPSPVTTVMNATAEQQCQSDERSDRERCINHIKHSLGFIDLTEVTRVELSQVVRNNLSNPTEEQPSSDRHSRIILLALKNELAVKLEAQSSDTAREWVSCLSDLVKYWQARRAADAKERILTAKANNQSIYYGDGDDSKYWTENVRDKVAHVHAFANQYIWNMCIPNGCRDITKSGVLYCRPHLRYTFEKFHFILACDNLLYYDFHSRRISGRAIPCTHHKRRGIIRLHDCYAYSGSVADDLTYPANAWYKAAADSDLPCIYGDQTFSIDEEDDCTFVIWKNTRRYCFGKQGSSIALKRKVKLDSVGKRWIFRARNRAECEEWVYALNIEIERARDSIKNQRNSKK